MAYNVEYFYSDLTKLKEGKLAILLGAGASYDYGIPTMHEIAQVLARKLSSPDPDSYFSEESRTVLRAIAGLSLFDTTRDTDTVNWNAEDLLTRLYYLEETLSDTGPFPTAETQISGQSVTREQVIKAQEELTSFLAECLRLDSEIISRGDRDITYLADFLEFIGRFHRTILIFTTNNDLCLEAAVTQLAHRQQSPQRKEFYLVDGFSTGLLPSFSISNYTLTMPESPERVRVCLWKLHGSIDWTYSNRFSGDWNPADAENPTFGDHSVICRRSEHLWNALHHARVIATKAPDRTRIMIFPSPVKYSQSYTNPYMDLYQAFRRTLEAIEVLLVVGTSFPDAHINSAIKVFLRRKESVMYVVDPNLSDHKVKSILGDHSSIQSVINLGFREFVRQLVEIETGTQEVSEPAKETPR